MKTLSYSNVKYTTRVPLILSQSRKSNMKISILSFFSLRRNTKTVWRIRMIWTPNNYSTIRDFLFLGESYIQAKISELWPQTYIAASFWHTILWVLTHITWKLQGVQRCSTHWTTALLSKMFTVWVKAGCEIWLASYGSKHVLQSLSSTPFVHPSMHNLKTTGRTCM